MLREGSLINNMCDGINCSSKASAKKLFKKKCVGHFGVGLKRTSAGLTKVLLLGLAMVQSGTGQWWKGPSPTTEINRQLDI